jgi:hypothetical protein
MTGIGMGFAATPDYRANIEDTLLFASVEAIDREDFRILAILIAWFGTHHPWVNADRLVKLVEALGSQRVRAFWAAIAHWQASDRRLSRLESMYRGPRIDPLGPATEFHVRRHGEDDRFRSSPLRLPAHFARARSADVLTPLELAARQRAYRWRIVIGPSYRADIWAELDRDPLLHPAELARRAYASFATAWIARRDFQIVRAASGYGQPSESA